MDETKGGRVFIKVNSTGGVEKNVTSKDFIYYQVTFNRTGGCSKLTLGEQYVKFVLSDNRATSLTSICYPAVHVEETVQLGYHPLVF